MKRDYTELDREILRYIGATPSFPPMYSARVMEQATTMARSEGKLRWPRDTQSRAYEIVKQRLQTLRRRGAIEYDHHVGYWREVTS